MRGTARFLAIVGGAAVAYGGFMPWLDNTKASTFPIRDFVSGVARGRSGWASSLAIILIIAAVLVALGALIDSRIAVFLGLLVGLAIAGGWLAQMVIHQPDFAAADLRNGFWVSAGGLVCTLLSAAWPGARHYDDAAMYFGG